MRWSGVLGVAAAVLAAGYALMASGAAVARVSTPPPLLMATAVVPGSTEPQRAVYPLDSLFQGLLAPPYGGVRIDRQPGPDTILLLAPTHVEVRSGGWVRTKPCVRIRLRATLHPGVLDPFSIAEAIVPVADATSYDAESRGLDGLDTAADAPSVRLVRQRDAPNRRVGAQTRKVEVTDWSHGALRGFSAMSARATVLRRSPTCRDHRFRLLPEDLPKPARLGSVARSSRVPAPRHRSAGS